MDMKPRFPLDSVPIEVLISAGALVGIVLVLIVDWVFG